MTLFDELIDVVEQQGLNFKQCTAIMDALTEFKDKYAYPIEMTKEQANEFIRLKSTGLTFFGFYSSLLPDSELGSSGNPTFYDIGQEDLMRAWLNLELIEVIEDD